MLHVQWTEVPIMEQHGKILDYHLKIYEYGINTPSYIVNSTNREFIFYQLKYFQHYNVVIKARNNVGFGPERVISITTNESGNVLIVV